MAKNKLTDLNNHLFQQLERLNDETLSKEEIKLEIQKAKAISGIAKEIIENAKVTLEASKFAYEKLDGNKQLPELFPEK